MTDKQALKEARTGSYTVWDTRESAIHSGLNPQAVAIKQFTLIADEGEGLPKAPGVAAA